MRRWKPLILVALLFHVALLTPTLVTPKRAMAATHHGGTASTTNFKGKASVYYRNTGPYFVVNFTCSSSQLSGNWTYDTRVNTYSGTLGTATDFATCALSGPNGGPWSSSISPIPLYYLGSKTNATLTLTLSNISASKTYVPDTTTCPNPTNNPCIEITTSGLGSVAGSDFNSNPTPAPSPPPYATLNLTLP